MPAQTSPAKFCIFCGEHPTSKTKEHVLPRWLIELTGDPKREAVFDVDFSKRPFELRRFAFDQFTFPACNECNGIFSTLETAVKPIVQKLLTANRLTNKDFDVLLDWLDKVRVGLWLAKYFLDKNLMGINPRFHIATRMRKSDRSLVVFRTNATRQRLSFSGTFGPTFQLSPVAVGLLINEFLLVNISHVDLCSRRLGFPFLQVEGFLEDRGLWGSPRPGLERIIFPIIPSFSHPVATGIYQPIFSAFLQSEEILHYVETDYVRSNSLEWDKGIGNIFIQRHGQIKKYPEIESDNWLPAESNFGRAVKAADDYISRVQLEQFKLGVRLAKGDLRQHLKKYVPGLNSLHKVFQKRRKEFWDFA